MAVAYKVAASSRRSGVSQGYPSSPSPRENPWKPYRLKLFPRKINERWYKPGDLVYRRYVLSPGGGFYEYGDDFDYLKWNDTV